MFFEDLERDTFGRLFGKRRDNAPGSSPAVSTTADQRPPRDGPTARPVRRASRLCGSPPRGPHRPAPLSQRNRQVQHPSRLELCGLRPLRRGVPLRRAREARRLRADDRGRSDYRCIGRECARRALFVRHACPQQALSVSPRPRPSRPWAIAAGRGDLLVQHLADGRDRARPGAAFGERGGRLGRRLR